MNIGAIRQVALCSDNLDQSVDFYQNTLGTTSMGRFDPPGISIFNFSGTRLLLESEGPVSTICFWVDDIDSACASLRDKGVTVGDPEVNFEDATGIFGPAGEAETMAFFEDSSGNTLAFASRRQTSD
jgi:catechol 2,3-dioxygenase-like lactoylglutathione lyase family enzyme